MFNKFWTLNKVLVLALLGGFAFLMLEIRYEHRAVLLDERAAWIPIIYSGLTLLIGGILLALWERGGRLILSLWFGGAMIVGGLGVWFHSGGHPLKAAALAGQSAKLVLSKPQSPDAASAAPEADVGGPPLLAPLAFCGLGMFGLLACSRRLAAETASTPAPAQPLLLPQTAAEKTTASLS